MHVPGSNSARAYFVEFDRATFSNYQWSDDLLADFEQELERKVKLLALIKGQVVMPASHLLESELAREFINLHPAAITRGVIVPALRDDVNSMREFLALKRASEASRWYQSSEADVLATLIDGHSHPLRWSAQQTSEWLRGRLLCDLADPSSVLRSRAHRVTDQQCQEIGERIRASPSVSRAALLAAVRAVVKRIPVVDKDDPFDDYIDFLYYLSGAIAVGGQGVLPQENLVRFDIATPSVRTERLSEYEIFYRLFLLIVRSHTQCLLHESALDHMTLDDIADLRSLPAHAAFVAKYDSLLARARRSTTIQDGAGLVLHLEELEALEWELRQAFTKTIACEVDARAAVLGQESDDEALLSSIGSILTFYEGREQVSQVAANGLAATRSVQVARDVHERTQLILGRLHGLLDRMNTRGIRDRDVLLAFLARVEDRYRGVSTQ